MVIKLFITIHIEEFQIEIWDKAILELLCFSATKTRELVNSDRTYAERDETSNARERHDPQSFINKVGTSS